MLSMFKGARKALSMALALSVLSCTNGLSRRRNEQHDPYHAPRYHAEPDPEPASGAQVEGEGSHRGVVAEHEARGCEAEATGEGEVTRYERTLVDMAIAGWTVAAIGWA